MGLDVYLSDRFRYEQNERYEEESNALYERKDRGEITEEQYEELRKEITPYASAEDVPSERWPDHLFNRRYLRSSYNSGGFNHAVPEMLGTANGTYPRERGSLDWIFEPIRLDEQYDLELTEVSIEPLREAKTRALRIADELRQSDHLRVKTVSANIFTPSPMVTDSDALRMYRGLIAERPIAPSDWFSNRDMDVFGDGLKVLAAIPGKGTFDEPAVHLIYRSESVESYIQSAEITAEFCDEAIMLIRRDSSCFLYWSG